MLVRKLGMLIGVISTAVVSAAAHAGSTLYYNNSTYTGLESSPFGINSPNFVVENFEDGLVNALGLTANTGQIKGAGGKTDSVDADGGGQMDGKGKDGSSYTSGSSKSISFSFDTSSIGAMVTAAGLVFTDGKEDCRITFKAWDADGNLITKIKKYLGDGSRKGTTGEDRFFGIASDEGISKIQISSNYAGFEVDHVQFAYSFAAVPVPAPLALGAAGLAAIVLRNRRSRWARQL